MITCPLTVDASLMNLSNSVPKESPDKVAEGSLKGREQQRQKRIQFDDFTQSGRKAADTKIDWDEWVSATSTRNYLIKDPLLDWLSKYSSRLSYTHAEYSSHIVKAVNQKSKPNFIEFVMEQGKIFESKVMEYLYKTHGSDIIIDVGGDLNARSKQKVQETLDAMNRGIPIIHSGVLHNENNNRIMAACDVSVCFC
jgi:hypothetical protein